MPFESCDDSMVSQYVCFCLLWPTSLNGITCPSGFPLVCTRAPTNSRQLYWADGLNLNTHIRIYTQSSITFMVAAEGQRGVSEGQVYWMNVLPTHQLRFCSQRLNNGAGGVKGSANKPKEKPKLGHVFPKNAAYASTEVTVRGCRRLWTVCSKTTPISTGISGFFHERRNSKRLNQKGQRVAGPQNMFIQQAQSRRPRDLHHLWAVDSQLPGASLLSGHRHDY